MSRDEDLGPYARLYLCLADDEKFADIYDDDRHFATYCRLLMIAEGPWPASAHLPMTARAASVRALADARIIDLQPGGRYRVHGLDAERERRSAAGKAGAAARWKRPESDRNAVALPPQSVTNASRAKPRRDEPSIAPAREGLPNLNSAVASLWEQATGRTVLASGNYAAEYLDDACRRHPPSEVGAAILRARKGFDHIPDAAQLVSAMRPILDPLPDRKVSGAKQREAEEQAASRRRTEDTLRRTHALGAHQTPNPNCPSCREGAAA